MIGLIELAPETAREYALGMLRFPQRIRVPRVSGDVVRALNSLCDEGVARLVRRSDGIGLRYELVEAR